MPPSKQVYDFDDIRCAMGEAFGDCSKLGIEWSLKASERSISDQDRFTCWISASEGQHDDFNTLAQQLEMLGAPAEILEAQLSLAPFSVKQGLSVARLDKDVGMRLYVHHLEPETQSDQYDSFRWHKDGRVETATYEFHFLPESPSGETPLSIADPVFESVLTEILKMERVQQLSGFWLRRRNGQIDQVDLIFPWQPRLGDFEVPLRALTNLLSAPDGWIESYSEDPLRHLAFSTNESNKVQVSAYFSGYSGQAWPDTMQALQQIVRENGAVDRTTMEQVFFQTPSESAAAPAQILDDFYSTERVDAWRQALGPEMHYHAGLFELPISGDAPDDALMEAAGRRAVEVLYPFFPEGGRVYDIGCGWGGPMQMLVRDLKCKVIGLTVSKTQFRHCASTGLQVRYGNAETTLPPGVFDCILMLESFSHIRDKPRLLRVLRPFGKRLIMRVNCQDGAQNSVNFGGTMHMVRSYELRAAIEEAGWRIVHWRDCRAEALPMVFAWHRRLQAVPATDDPHLEILRAYCRRVLLFPDEWAANNPLIEVVCE